MNQRERQHEEVHRNFEAFQKCFAELYHKHPGKVALMKDAEVVEVFDTVSDALKVGRMQFGDEVFSVQKIEESKIRLGFMGYALLHGLSK